MRNCKGSSFNGGIYQKFGNWRRKGYFSFDALFDNIPLFVKFSSKKKGTASKMTSIRKTFVYFRQKYGQVENEKRT